MTSLISKTIFLPDEKATLELGSKLAAIVANHFVIYLHGQLGAGKTTLVRGFLQGLGYEGKVKSPTYTLVESYELQNKRIYHFDLYRLQSPEELELIGIRDFFESSICLIEWPERGKGFLPQADLCCELKIKNSGREIQCAAYTDLGGKIIVNLL